MTKKTLKKILKRIERLEEVIEKSEIALDKNSCIQFKVEEEPYDPTCRAWEGEKYWYIEGGRLTWTQEQGCSFDDNHWLTGNYFKTKKQAENKLEYDKALVKIKRYIWENFGHWEPDWKDKYEEKYFICSGIGGLDYTYISIGKELYPLPYLKNKREIKQLIKDMEPELKIILNYNQ